MARYAQIAARDGSDVKGSIRDIDLEPLFVVNTPQVMNTMDVYIYDTSKEAVILSTQIVKIFGSDGTKANFSLL